MRNVSINYSVCLGREAMAASKDDDSIIVSINALELFGLDLCFASFTLLYVDIVGRRCSVCLMGCSLPCFVCIDVASRGVQLDVCSQETCMLLDCRVGCDVVCSSATVTTAGWF